VNLNTSQNTIFDVQACGLQVAPVAQGPLAARRSPEELKRERHAIRSSLERTLETFFSPGEAVELRYRTRKSPVPTRRRAEPESHSRC
jgi:hypothetical protein